MTTKTKIRWSKKINDKNETMKNTMIKIKTCINMGTKDDILSKKKVEVFFFLVSMVVFVMFMFMCFLFLFFTLIFYVCIAQID